MQFYSPLDAFLASGQAPVGHPELVNKSHTVPLLWTPGLGSRRSPGACKQETCHTVPLLWTPGLGSRRSPGACKPESYRTFALD
jgi:hypothetical protein